jgi:hypothetical protein
LVLKRPIRLRVGDIVVLRHQVYGADAFRVTRCRDVRFDGVSVYAAPGMALLAAGSTNITVERFRVEPRPGTMRLMSTCADGLHFAWCRGTIDIRNCRLAGLGDDCINVHGRNFVVAERVDARTILVDRPEHEPLRDVELASSGDVVEFLARPGFTPLGERRIAQAVAKTFQFTEDLPASLAPGDFLCDIGEITQVTISDCQFPGNRGRGILAHRNSAIERCSFANQFYEAVLIAFGAEFNDGPTIADVAIVKNTFNGTGRAEFARGAIRVRGFAPRADGAAKSVSEVIGRGVRIANNIIRDSGASAIEVGETRDVAITGNRIERRDGPAIVLQNVRRASVSGNVCEPPAALHIRDTPDGEVTLRGNTSLRA